MYPEWIICFRIVHSIVLAYKPWRGWLQWLHNYSMWLPIYVKVWEISLFKDKNNFSHMQCDVTWRQDIHNVLPDGMPIWPKRDSIEKWGLKTVLKKDLDKVSRNIIEDICRLCVFRVCKSLTSSKQKNSNWFTKNEEGEKWRRKEKQLKVKMICDLWRRLSSTSTKNIYIMSLESLLSTPLCI